MRCNDRKRDASLMSGARPGHRVLDTILRRWTSISIASHVMSSSATQGLMASDPQCPICYDTLGIHGGPATLPCGFTLISTSPSC